MVYSILHKKERQEQIQNCLKEFSSIICQIQMLLLDFPLLILNIDMDNVQISQYTVFQNDISFYELAKRMIIFRSN